MRSASFRAITKTDRGRGRSSAARRSKGLLSYNKDRTLSGAASRTSSRFGVTTATRIAVVTRGPAGDEAAAILLAEKFRDLRAGLRDVEHAVEVAVRAGNGH